METSEEILHRKEEEWSEWPDGFLTEEIEKMEKDVERVKYEIERGAGPIQEKFLKGQKAWLGALQQHKKNR